MKRGGGRIGSLPAVLNVLLTENLVVAEPVEGNLVPANLLVALTAPAEGVVEEDTDTAVLISGDNILIRVWKLSLELADFHAREAAVLVSLLDGDVEIVLVGILNFVGDVEGGAEEWIVGLIDTVAILLGMFNELADNLLG